MMLELNGAFKASGLVFDPEVTSESESEAKPEDKPEEVKMTVEVSQPQQDDSEASASTRGSDVDVS